MRSRLADAVRTGALAGAVPSPTAVDWGVLASAVLALATGAVGLVTGRPSGAWVFAVHGVAGAVLLVLLALKLWRVRARLAPGRLSSRRALSAVLAAVALLAVLTGVAWTLGAASPVGFWTLLTVHGALGVALVPLLAAHLRYRWRPVRAAAGRLDGRRTAIRYLALAAVGGLAWRLGQGVATAVGGERRFTGSREEGSGAGNGFPVTSWVADDPDPVDPAAWSLSVGGLVEEPLELGAGDLAPDASRQATLDCTSGWYSVHDWRGVRVGDLLDAAGVAPEARRVAFRSVTGYRWSLPLDEAREALLATHVEEERLDHGHGYPLRLVAPGRRGFQWVKWVEAVEVRRRRDPGELVAIFVSGFDGTGGSEQA